MSRSGFEVEGLRQVVKALLETGVDLNDLKDAFAAIAAEGAQLAARYAPRKTGALAASARGNRAKGKAAVILGKARVPYAGAINYGWAKRNIRGAGFMQRADQEMRPVAVQRLEDNINAIIARKGLAP